ncbi:MAG: hypothetical protein H7315_03545 [Herminiimonas sp.]|nr:hypothetical protein [Herminiimonas sp.]
MNEKIRTILNDIIALEDELATTLREQQSKIFFEVDGKRAHFDRVLREEHRKLKSSLLHWLVTYRPQNLVTGPIIYGMIFPLLLVDLCISFYQACCFPIYGIVKVQRAHYFIFDRQHLGYLNIIEKFHCTYCAYGTGLIAYCTEIISRTEQYFCPIKHARKMLGRQARYADFLEFGEAADYEKKLEEYRLALGKSE